MSEDIGAGLVVYHPNGAVLRFIIEDFLKEEHAKRDYQFVVSPHIMKASTWKTSGHYQMQYPMYFFERMAGSSFASPFSKAARSACTADFSM